MTEEPDGNSTWKETVLSHRQEKTKTFESATESPLGESARTGFDGLEFYPFSKDYQFEGRLERFPKAEKVSLQATRGPPMNFSHVGQLGVEIEDDLSVLAVYRSPGVDALLVPFRDQTNGHETWTKGRYLNVSNPPREEGEGSRPVEVLVDFNLAYHPLCVYDPEVRSVVPPAENELNTSLRAGERLPAENNVE